MKKHLIVIGMTLVLLIVGLSGCTENGGGNKFVGTWTYTGGYFYNDIIVLYSDGVLSTTRHGSSGDHVQSGTWEANETHLILHKNPSGQLTEGFDEIYSYTFSNDQTLLLTAGEISGTYKRS